MTAAAESGARAAAEERRGARRAVLPWIALAAAIQAALWLAILPPWLGEDEPWQVEAVHHVAAGHWPAWGSGLGERAFEAQDVGATPLSVLQTLRRFPTLERSEALAVQAQLMDELRAAGVFERVAWLKRDRGRQSFDAIVAGMTATHHPPLYCAGVGTLARALASTAPAAPAAAELDRALERELRIARFVSAACWVAFVVAGAACARALGASPSLAAAALAFAPVSWRASAIAGNDAPAMLAGALAILFALRMSADTGGRATSAAPRRALAGALVIALALAVKPSTLVAAGTAAVALVLSFRARRRWLALAAGRLALVFAAAIALWLAGHAPAVPKSLAALLERLAHGLSASNLRRLAATSAGMHTWESQALSTWFYAAAGLLALAGAAAALLALARSRTARLALYLAAATAVLQLALVIARGESRGRYLLPALPAAAALASAGIGALGEPWRARAGWAWSAGLALLGAVYVAGGLALGALEGRGTSTALAYAAALACFGLARRAERGS